MATQFSNSASAIDLVDALRGIATTAQQNRNKNANRVAPVTRAPALQMSPIPNNNVYVPPQSANEDGAYASKVLNEYTNPGFSKYREMAQYTPVGNRGADTTGNTAGFSGLLKGLFSKGGLEGVGALAGGAGSLIQAYGALRSAGIAEDDLEHRKNIDLKNLYAMQEGINADRLARGDFARKTQRNPYIPELLSVV